jgi:hypothetical protein
MVIVHGISRLYFTYTFYLLLPLLAHSQIHEPLICVHFLLESLTLLVSLRLDTVSELPIGNVGVCFQEYRLPKVDGSMQAGRNRWKQLDGTYRELGYSRSQGSWIQGRL